MSFETASEILFAWVDARPTTRSFEVESNAPHGVTLTLSDAWGPRGGLEGRAFRARSHGAAWRRAAAAIHAGELPA